MSININLFPIHTLIGKDDKLISGFDKDVCNRMKGYEKEFV